MELQDYYNDIPTGKKNAVTKDILTIKWDTSERTARRIIRELRLADFGDDYIIISRSCGKGYYKTNDLKEIEEYKKEVLNRGRHTFAPLAKVNRILAAGQNSTLKQIRKAKGLSNVEVIAAIKQTDPSFDKSILSRYENGKSVPTKKQLEIMAELYEVSLEELIAASENLPI